MLAVIGLIAVYFSHANVMDAEVRACQEVPQSKICQREGVKIEMTNRENGKYPLFYGDKNEK